MMSALQWLQLINDEGSAVIAINRSGSPLISSLTNGASASRVRLVLNGATCRGAPWDLPIDSWSEGAAAMKPHEAPLLIN